jgi:hypothetical protein
LIRGTTHDAFVHPLVSRANVHAVHHVFASKYKEAVHHILCTPSHKAHIAVLGEPPVMRVLTIDASDSIIIYNGYLWNSLQKFSELGKERLQEVVPYSIINRSPFVAPPTLVAVNNQPRVRIVERDN